MRSFQYYPILCEGEAYDYVPGTQITESVYLITLYGEWAMGSDDES